MGIVTLLTAAFFFCRAVLILGFVLFRLDNIGRRWLRRIRGIFLRRRQLRFELLDSLLLSFYGSLLGIYRLLLQANNSFELIDFAQKRVKLLLKSLRHNHKDNILSNIKKDQLACLFSWTGTKISAKILFTHENAKNSAKKLPK